MAKRVMTGFFLVIRELVVSHCSEKTDCSVCLYPNQGGLVS